MSDLYNIESYDEGEMYSILDLVNPSDRELEAKLLMMIDKYNNINSKSGDKLKKFFQNMYNHFFSNEEESDNEYDSEDEDDIIETMVNIKENKEALKNSVDNQKEKTIKNVSEETEDQDKEEPDNENVIYTKQLDYTKGGLNPLLKQTTRRVISIDSQYRADKTTMSTEFTCNLSEPLKDVVSLKLYSIQIPFTWYTIGKSYGSNFFYIKGRTPGIDNESHDIQVSILSGNYKPQELIDTVNVSLTIADGYTDATLTGSQILYNPNTALCNFTVNIVKRFNQSSYYIYFDNWESPYNVDEERNNSIPAYLGFQTDQYDLNSITSPLYYSLPDSTIADTDTFLLTPLSNSITIINYSGTDEYIVDTSIVHKTINLSLTLPLDNSYTRQELTTNLNTQLSLHPDLVDSSITRINTDSRNAEFVSLVSYFKLKVNLNRMNIDTTIVGSKIVIILPATDTTIWRGENSCFRFDEQYQETTTIYGNLTPIEQNDRYIITNNPQIEIICVNENFIDNVNDIIIQLDNSTAEGFTITQYIQAINDGLRTADNEYNLTYGHKLLNTPDEDYEYDTSTTDEPLGTIAYLKDNKLKLYLKIERKFNNTHYEMDVSNGIFNTVIRLISGTQNGFVTYYSNLLDLTQTYESIVSIASRTVRPTDIICLIKPHRTNAEGNDADEEYTLTFETVLSETTSLSYPQIEGLINRVFNNYQDPISKRNIFQGSRLTSSVLNNAYNIKFNIVINKVLLSNSYSVQFIDPENTWETNLFIDPLMIDEAYDIPETIPENDPTIAYNSSNIQILQMNANGNTTITASNQIAQSNVITIDTGINDTIRLIGNENGVKTDTGYNDVELTIPSGVYSTDFLIQTINETINTYTGLVSLNCSVSLTERNDGNKYVKIINGITRKYDSKDFNLVFYDRESFSQCFSGAKSVQNTTWDTTVGWIMGFRDFTSYDLSAPQFNNLNITSVFGDTGISTSLFNYFLLCLDDYNQNRLNDGLVTITGTDTSIPLPSYAKRSEFFCDPVTGEKTYNTTTGLTEKQIYAANEIANASSAPDSIGSSVSTKSYGTGPFVTDVFGLIPVKTNGLLNGAPYVEFGGTLQNQERTYFGPVNINRLSVRLVTDRGNTVDLNNANWSFSLICEQLNKLDPNK